MALLTQMQVFVEVVEAGSASRAAERLGIANSAVSRRLKELETYLGVSLLRRTTRQMSLTDAGTQYLQRCRAILDAVEDARDEVAAGTNEASGTLRIALPVSFSIRRMAPLIAEFSRRHPGLNIDLAMNDRHSDLVADGIDVAIRIGRLPDSGLMARPLARVHHIVCASPQLLAQRAPITVPEDLREHPTLCYSNLTQPNRWLHTDAHGHETTVSLEPILSATNGDMLCALAVAGLGIVCEPSFIVHEALEAGELVPLLQDWSWYGIDIYAIYPATRHLPRRSRLFIDFMAEKLSETPYWEKHVKLPRNARSR
jgi:DNA-binding transcriptional LysR family regulator